MHSTFSVILMPFRLRFHLSTVFVDASDVKFCLLGIFIRNFSLPPRHQSVFYHVHFDWPNMA